MPYLAISDFKYGMDRRRPQAVGVPGTLWTLKNAVITRGGDIEGAKKWVDEYTLPADTFGLYVLRGQPWVFGSGTDPGVPAGVNYQQLQAPDTPDMTRVVDVKAFDGKLYVIAQFDDGNTYHFYDGSRITSWDTIAAGGGAFATVASQLATLIEQSGAVSAVATGPDIRITANVPGTAFTISTLAEDVDSDISNPTAAKVQNTANVAGVAGVKAAGSVEITGGSEGDGNDIEQVTIDPGTAVTLLPPQVAEERAIGSITITGGSDGGKITRVQIGGSSNLLQSDVNWQGSSNATAEALREEINDQASFSGISASRSNNTVYLRAPEGSGSSYNGRTVSVQKTNISTTKSDMQGGSDAVIPVPFDTDNATTAAALADAINEDYLGHGYTAEATGAVVEITAPSDGTSFNGATVVTEVNGNVTKTDTNFSGGVNGVTAVAQVETVTISGSPFDPEDRWSVTINGTTYSVTGGSSQGIDGALAVMKRRVFATIDSLLRYCVVNDPTDWTTTADESTDSGFINVSTDSDGAQKLVGLGLYDGKLAIFSETNIVVYDIFVDAEQIALSTTLERTGTIAARSIVPYGNNDVFYLTRNGIRSIRARAGTTTPATADVGGLIDNFVRETLRDTDEDSIKRAVAEVEPVDGLYMLAIGDRIFVLSQYTESKITAWSYMEPGFAASDMHSDGRRLYARDEDTIYVYGGMDGTTYPDEGEDETEVIMPFMSADDPAGLKMLQGFDVSLRGDWQTEILVDPNDETKSANVGIINEITYDLASIKVPARTSHMALSMTCDSAGQRLLSSLAIHYEKEGAE
jgi:hypothetical protein